ncbi:putative ribulose bisphosphate carboxylaseoxygenase,large subunit [Fulvimarina pelagi HTCC2506]|uniref:Putative ribulose bisphosphate carboxylaseoxygenase,large subunit n=1 Tax=Fulvimarina pelagi HTCC2506 TaxID=314231 RepID=Q0G448_9HYPH|nr:ribulose-bisphosphate carboxylase large subunit family protein [Fulvimarina pelagi]EAU41633.1 putative ribulose bisphosphate carboxylaseoxygenase,large subunit [Fulvimarina pelagi HTCC2506]
MVERLTVDYSLRTQDDPRKVAETIAGEQSSGTFIATPGEDAALKERAAATVEILEEFEDEGSPVLPGSSGGDRARSFGLRLSWPMTNFGPSIPNLLATIAGNLFELKGVAGLKIQDIHLPESFKTAYLGPGFGIEGTRRVAGVSRGPIVGTIIKPSVGLDPDETASLVEALCEGGIDFIKDDELQADGPHCPFDERLRAVMAVIDRHADRLGRKVMYAINLTGEIDEMLRRHDLVAETGGTCVMVSLNSVGPTGLTALRRHSSLPIHAHRNGWGYLGRSPDNGWSYRAWHKIWRLAGADHMHVNGIANKFWEPDDSVIESAKACLDPLFADRPDRVMPVFSSGQTVMTAHPTFERLGADDLIFTAGGGIVAHPQGVAAGVRSLREAWEAAVAGVPLEEAAKNSAALSKAIETYS